MELHERGSILVAAIFEAFINIYKRRVADILRLASGGSGILPQGELHPDLVNRLAKEACKSASHVLNIHATLDYNIINEGCTSTMPNRALLTAPLRRTKGRLMIMNENKLFFDFNGKVNLKHKIEEARGRMTAKERAAERKFIQKKLFLEHVVEV